MQGRGEVCVTTGERDFTTRRNCHLVELSLQPLPLPSSMVRVGLRVQPSNQTLGFSWWPVLHSKLSKDPAYVAS